MFFKFFFFLQNTSYIYLKRYRDLKSYFLNSIYSNQWLFGLCSSRNETKKLVLLTLHLKTCKSIESAESTHPVDRRVTFFYFFLICCFSNKVVVMGLHFDKASAPRVRNALLVQFLTCPSIHTSLSEGFAVSPAYCIYRYRYIDIFSSFFFFPTLFDSEFFHVTKSISFWEGMYNRSYLFLLTFLCL